MRLVRSSMLVGVLLSATFGCLPDAKSTVDRARIAEDKCHNVPATTLEPVLSKAVVDSVEPAYSYTLGGPNGRIARLVGAQVHMRPVHGESREWVERALECHEARVALGEACATPDPYHSEIGWVDIDVQSERDGYVVRLTSDDIEDAHAILERARAFRN